MDFLQLQCIFFYTIVVNTVRSEYVLVTVDVNDIKRVARYFVSEPVADKIAEFIVSMGVKQEVMNDGNKVESLTNFKFKNSDENDELSKSSIETPAFKKHHKDIMHKSHNDGKLLPVMDNMKHKTVKKFIPDDNDESDDATEGYKDFLVKYNEKAKKHEHEHDKRKHVTVKSKTSFYQRRRASDSDEIESNNKLSTNTPELSSLAPKSGDFDEFTATKVLQRESLE